MDYLAERTAKYASLDEFEAALPADVFMVARRQHKILVILVAEKAS
jgi:hypothetical protein